MGGAGGEKKNHYVLRESWMQLANLRVIHKHSMELYHVGMAELCHDRRLLQVLHLIPGFVPPQVNPHALSRYLPHALTEPPPCLVDPIRIE